MVDPGVHKQIAAAGTGEETQSVMLQWAETPGDSLFAGLTSKRERMRVMDEYYRNLKAKIFRVLEGEPGVRIQDLPASGQAILTGPAKKLEALVRPGGVLDREEKVQVLPNASFQAFATLSKKPHRP